MKEAEPYPARHRAPAALVKEFSDFYRENNKKLFLHLLWCGASENLAKDVMQECMIEMYRRWDSIENPKPYLFISAKRMLARAGVDRQNEILYGSLPEPADSAVGCALADFEAEHVMMQAIKSLPLRRREVMSLQLAGFSTDETAKILGIESATVRTHRKIARKEIATFLEEGER